MRIAAYVVLLLGLATLLPWLAVAPFSIMAFDKGPNLMAYVLVGLMLSYPVWLLAWLWAGWRRLRADDAKKAIIFGLVGMLPALLLAVPLSLPGH